MNVAVITEGKNHYYVNLESNHGKLSYYVVCANNDYIYCLKEKEARNLFTNMFQSNLKYLYKKNNYDIYEDEAGNKRYFQDGVEDYYRFFVYNGKQALLSEEEKEKKNSNLFSNLLKSFSFENYGIKYIAIISLIGLAIFLKAHPINEYADKIEYNVKSYFHIYETLDKNKAMDYVINSSVDLVDEKKSFLANEQFISDVLEIADPYRKYVLNSRLCDFQLHYFTEEEKKEDEARAGYCYLNTIALKDSSEDVFTYAAAHEFVHFLQDDNLYLYIREASAEMMKWEYFGIEAQAYPDARKRVGALMEIIGPKTIMECNFKGDTSTFEEEIRKYLKDDEAEELLELFKHSPYDDKDIAKVDKRIDELLKIMYQNTCHQNIENDETITNIYNGKLNDRFYFNQHSDEFYKQTVVVEKEYPVYYFDKEEVDTYRCDFSDKITEEQYHSYIENKDDNKVICTYEEYLHDLNANTIDDKIRLIHKKDDNGKDNYYKFRVYSFSSFDEFLNFSKAPNISEVVEGDTENTNYSYEMNRVVVKDGSMRRYIGVVDGKIECQDYYPTEKITTILPISEKFREQVKTKNIVENQKVIYKK